jgi:two-component system, NtrC family, nitrogen regulation sensor histidine kinase NtrY
VSPRKRFLSYLVLLHVLFAGVAFALLRRQGRPGPGLSQGDRWWLIGGELTFLLSLGVGAWLLNGLFRPLALVRDSARLLAERDFATRFRPVGQPEIDELIQVYNGMADGLREERVRQQEQQNFLRQVLEGSPSGILTLDVEGRIDYANPAALRLLQVQAAGALGQRLKDLASPLARAADGLAGGQSTVAAALGGRRVRLVQGSFVDRGFPRRFVLLEEMTEELRRYERLAYEKLIRMLSHEVNNSAGAASSLLHSCLNYAPQLRDGDREDYENAVRVVISRTEHLSSFMKGFADVVRLPAPRKALSDVREVLESTLTLWRPEARSRRIAWEWEVGGTPVPVSFDRAQMEQVFVNLLKNAIEAVGQDGRITLRLGQRGRRAFLEVEDTGPGLSEEARTNLFTPFFTTKAGGQGLGLTLVKEVLGQHGFDYSLEGPPGGPTRFTIFF